MGGFNFVEGILLLPIVGTGRFPSKRTSKRTETERTVTVMADGRRDELLVLVDEIKRKRRVKGRAKQKQKVWKDK